MKIFKKGKIIAVSLMLMVLNVLVACNTDQQKKRPPYTLINGGYEYENAVFTNLYTNEVTERTFDDIINDNELFKYWGCLFSFSVGISEQTEFILKDNRWYLLDEGLAYEVIDDNTLKLHFPRWDAYDYQRYDIVIFLCWAKRYG